MAEDWRYCLKYDEEHIELSVGRSTIGRSRACDVSVEDPSVSRRHVYLTVGSGKILLQDLGSSNGTFVNEKRVYGQTELADGDTLRLGDAILRVEIRSTAFDTARIPALAMPPDKPAAELPAGVTPRDTVRIPVVPEEPAPAASKPRTPGTATMTLQEASIRLAQQAMGADVSSLAPPLAEPPVPSERPVPPTEEIPVGHLPEDLQPAVQRAAPPPPVATAQAAGPVTPPPPAAPPQAVPPQAVPPQAVPSQAAPPAAAPTPSPILPEALRAARPEPQPEPARATPAGESAPAESVRDDKLDAFGQPRTRGELLPSLDELDAVVGPPLSELPTGPRAAAPALAPSASPMAAAARVPELEPAGFWWRLGATLLDGLWIIALIWVAVLLWEQPGGLLASFVPLLVTLGGWGIWGTTPGKRLLGLYVCTTGGEVGIGFLRSAVRIAGYVVSTVTLGIGFLMVGFSERKLALHDRIAGTWVGRRV